MDNSRSMVEMHSSICEDIAGNSTNISPKRMLLGSITRNDAIILIEFSLKPFRSLTAICIQYVTIDLRNHVCLRVARISLHRLNVPACQNQLIGDTAVA